MSAIRYNTFLARSGSFSRLRGILALAILAILVFILLVKLGVVAHFCLFLFGNLPLKVFKVFK